MTTMPKTALSDEIVSIGKPVQHAKMRYEGEMYRRTLFLESRETKWEKWIPGQDARRPGQWCLLTYTLQQVLEKEYESLARCSTRD